MQLVRSVLCLTSTSFLAVLRETQDTPEPPAIPGRFRYPEGARIEFKSQVPSPDGKPAAWETGGRLSSYPRDKLLAEAVAFANTFGGYLVIGVAEDPVIPDHVGSGTPVARCEELAQWLRQQARDCIEPTISLLEATVLRTWMWPGSGLMARRCGFFVHRYTNIVRK